MAKQKQTEFAHRRQVLLEESFLNILESEKFSTITVKDICQEADIPRRTFYHYFECKEDVLDSLVNNLMMSCYSEVQFDVFPETVAMEEFFVRMFHFWQGENRRKLDALIRNHLETRLLAHASKWVEMEQIGFFRDNALDPKLAEIGTMVGISDFFSLLFYWSRNHYQEPPEKMAKYAVWVLSRTPFSL
ncbi:MAG: TetR/AcrR family transcriptional regulator [Oscillospiraceae bacterium]|nr:TetR/AcrR family transcriptional regulator [Oscillospiraceae bacterium]